LKLAIWAAFTLSACAQQSEVRQMHQSVSTLSKEMTQLNQQTVKITQQNALNAKSTSGVYLLPGAKTPARLKARSAHCACRCVISPPTPTVPA
jgi:hypothetical protein